jgi:L-Ala-D/L-Glu epimerase
MPSRTLHTAIESWPLTAPFVISRGAKTEARVVVATLNEGGIMGRGECVPYARYGETPDSLMAALASIDPDVTREALQGVLPAGAARNALDCALWDLEAKRAGKSVAALVQGPEPSAVVTCFTLSLGPPDDMARAAAAVPHLPLLKLKLGRADGRDGDRMRAVRGARPDARLVADANEGWTETNVEPLLEVAAEAEFELIEQPLPADSDGILAKIPHHVPVCADEGAHTAADLPALKARYDAVNIKLDKAGGLTEALKMAAAARELGFEIMTGCMVATSLAMAPAMLLAHVSRWVDLDGPLLLANDRPDGLQIKNGIITPPLRTLWG